MDSGSVTAFTNLMSAVTAIVLALIVVLGPVWLIVQYLKYKSARKMAPDEVAALERMTAVARRMEARMTAVERILDAESPAWRHEPDGAGGRYETHAG